MYVWLYGVLLTHTHPQTIHNAQTGIRMPITKPQKASLVIHKINLVVRNFLRVLTVAMPPNTIYNNSLLVKVQVKLK